MGMWLPRISAKLTPGCIGAIQPETQLEDMSAAYPRVQRRHPRAESTLRRFLRAFGACTGGFGGPVPAV